LPLPRCHRLSAVADLPSGSKAASALHSWDWP
jgi:hypothetical protein